ncbi:MAG: sulfatase, partial [Phycisphaerae bacterium]|nr:sulfatase [Phycisphaerae bacterium]
ILVDDLGWMDLGCQGSKYYQTPHIDRLAAEGMRFTDGYAACAVCSPTRAAVQTGRYPGRLFVTDWIRSRFQGGKIPEDRINPCLRPVNQWKGRKLRCPPNALWMESSEITIAEALKPAGYATGYIGKWHLGTDPWYPTEQGYDENFGGCDYGQPPSYFDPYSKKHKHPMIQAGIPHLPGRKKGEYLTDREADEAVGFIRRHRDKPFFLQLAHYAVHTPIQAKAEVTARYENKPKTLQKNAKYAAMVESVDDATGRILEILNQLNLADRTVIIFTSDNGGLLGPTNNKPLRSGKGYAYEGGIRVPWIIKWPGVARPGSVSDVPVTSVDLFPTIVKAAGRSLPTDRTIDGSDLKPVLAGTGNLDRDAIYWHFPHYRHAPGPYSIIRAGRWKLIKFYEGPTYELFDLDKDLGEARNLAADRLEQVSRLDAQLQTHLKAIGAKIPRSQQAPTAKHR